MKYLFQQCFAFSLTMRYSWRLFSTFVVLCGGLPLDFVWFIFDDCKRATNDWVLGLPLLYSFMNSENRTILAAALLMFSCDLFDEHSDRMSFMAYYSLSTGKPHCHCHHCGDEEVGVCFKIQFCLSFGSNPLTRNPGSNHMTKYWIRLLQPHQAPVRQTDILKWLMNVFFGL